MVSLRCRSHAWAASHCNCKHAKSVQQHEAKPASLAKSKSRQRLMLCSIGGWVAAVEAAHTKAASVSPTFNHRLPTDFNTIKMVIFCWILHQMLCSKISAGCLKCECKESHFFESRQCYLAKVLVMCNAESFGHSAVCVSCLKDLPCSTDTSLPNRGAGYHSLSLLIFSHHLARLHDCLASTSMWPMQYPNACNARSHRMFTAR